LGQIQGAATRFKIYSLPGNLDDQSIRKELAHAAFGCVFVVDSQEEKINENITLYKEMVRLIERGKVNKENFPVVLQYNKLDLPNAAPLVELQDRVNFFKYPYFKSVANQGTGVLPTLTTISKAVIRYIRQGGRPLQTTHTQDLEKAPSIPLAPSPSTSSSKNLGDGNSFLLFRQAISAGKNSDGSFIINIQLADPETGRLYNSNIRFEPGIHGGNIEFKWLPEE